MLNKHGANALNEEVSEEEVMAWCIPLIILIGRVALILLGLVCSWRGDRIQNYAP